MGEWEVIAQADWSLTLIPNTGSSTESILKHLSWPEGWSMKPGGSWKSISPRSSQRCFAPVTRVFLFLMINRCFTWVLAINSETLCRKEVRKSHGSRPLRLRQVLLYCYFPFLTHQKNVTGLVVLLSAGSCLQDSIFSRVHQQKIQWWHAGEETHSVFCFRHFFCIDIVRLLSLENTQFHFLTHKWCNTADHL